MEQINDILLETIVLPAQIRTNFDQSAIEGLARSLVEVGLMQPVRLRHEGQRYAPVDGERRIRAARLLHWKTIAAIIEADALTKPTLLQKQLIAGCQHSLLTPLEKSVAIERLMKATGWSASQTAAKLGLSSASVSKLLSLAALPEALREEVKRGRVSASAAYELACMTDNEARDAAAKQLANGQLTRDGLVNLKKRAKRPKTDAVPTKTKRATAHLGGGRQLTVAAGNLTLDGLIETLEEVLAKAKKARPQGLVLATFLQMLKDQAGA